MIRIVYGDLINDSKDNEAICHQVNCKGVMGSGVALQIKNHFPEIQPLYKECIIRNKDNVLGSIQHVYVKNTKGKSRLITNMFGQDSYGYQKQCYTSYDAFKQCCNELKASKQHLQTYTITTLAFPWKIGSDIGGADFKEIFKLILDLHYDFDITFYYLDVPKDLSTYTKYLQEQGIEFEIK